MEIKKWQYLVDDIEKREAIDERLGHWGSLGWELVTILEDKGEGKTERGQDFHYHWTLVFKQPAP